MGVEVAENKVVVMGVLEGAVRGETVGDWVLAARGVPWGFVASTAVRAGKSTSP